MPKNQRTASPKLSNTTAACPKVALLIETSRGYGRGLLRGIVRYARLHGPWSFYVTPSDFEQALPEMILWGGTGIIARVETPEMAKAIRAANLPTVLVGADPIAISHVPELEQFSEVSSDSEGAARMAAEHLLERGLGNFAYVGIPERKWSRLRGEAFCAAIQAAGYTPHVYIPPRSKKGRTWEREQKSLAEWIGAQPKPLGLMACNDDRN
jgi:LacI family transcriptional regulator